MGNEWRVYAVNRNIRLDPLRVIRYSRAYDEFTHDCNSSTHPYPPEPWLGVFALLVPCVTNDKTTNPRL